MQFLEHKWDISKDPKIILICNQITIQYIQKWCVLSIIQAIICFDDKIYLSQDGAEVKSNMYINYIQ